MKILKETELARRIVNNINNCVNQRLFGLNRGEKGLISSIIENKQIILTSDLLSATELKNQIIAGGKRVCVLSGMIEPPIYTSLIKKEKIFDIISNIYSFLLDEADVMIALSETVIQRFPNRKFFLDKLIVMERGKVIPYSKISSNLVEMGYIRVEFPDMKGEFSLKGDVLNIKPINKEKLVRIEFFDDEIEKIYEIEDSYKKELQNLNIYPATLVDIFDDDKLIVNLKKSIREKEQKETLPAIFKENVCEICEKVKMGNRDMSLFFTLPYLIDDDNYSEDIFTLLCDENTAVLLNEPKRILDDLDFTSRANNDNIDNLISSHELLDEHRSFYHNKHNFIQTIADKKTIFFENIRLRENIFNLSEELTVRTIGERKYVYDYNSLASDMHFYKKNNNIVILFAGSETSSKSLFNFLVENAIVPTLTDDLNNIRKEGIYITSHFLPQSASFTDYNIILIGTEDLVKKYAKQEYKLKNKKGVFTLPKVNDYVVHDVHGIGKCVGIERLKISDYERDYFIIEYKDKDKIYVPSEQANLISLYLGSDGEPKLNKIGGLEFAKAKEKVRNSVKEMAIDLLALYKERENSKGYIYPKDNYLQKEFEKAFEFEETDDQLKAVEEIKQDMESTRIMDRLICGDVGFGKTEVALRAAYKTILEGRQVALLCPTTILSEQHYQTAKKRMIDFFVNIASINRFKTKAMQDTILKELKEGKIDFIIGTSRLLSKDVQFKNLGLLILDEEQRFGVSDKETIKEIKKNVDVLAMSATPIPRTLHMSLSGIRDISIIETPPKNRLPVQTYICELTDDIIVSACRKELGRNGQTIIVYNRVEKIDSFRNHVSMLLPEARVGIAHGQMTERELENSIEKLYDEEYDIIIASTIIENGIDLPKANTLIVVDSIMLGLAQLYQLRGRVGRSNRLAYAYFTYDKNKDIPEIAYRRLEALTEFTELGSGFRIAMRDLEIRGAGDVLGAKQHGHLEKVGYDMYSRILNESVSELKGNKLIDKKDLKLDIMLSAYIPEDYIKDENERIKAYNNISEISGQNEMNVITFEMEEYFGKIPICVFNLIKIAFIKNMAQKICGKKVVINKEKCYIELYKNEKIIDEKTAIALENYKDIAVLKFENSPIISFDIKNLKIEQKLEKIIEFLIIATS